MSFHDLIKCVRSIRLLRQYSQVQMEHGENAAAAADEFVALAAMYGGGDAAVTILDDIPSQLSACCRACHADAKPFAFTVSPQVPDSMAPLLMPQPPSASDKQPRLCSVALLHNLPPIIVCGTLPATYPSHAPPTICVHAQWLSADDAAAVASRLVALWAEMPLMMAGLPCHAPLPVPAGSLVGRADVATASPVALPSMSEGFSARLLHCGEREPVSLGSSVAAASAELVCATKVEAGLLRGAAAALPAPLQLPRPRHTCQRVSFPCCSAATAVADSAGGAGVADEADTAHSHWGFEHIVQPDYTCAKCSHDAAVSVSGESSGYAGGGGAVCLFSWVEWLRSESVPWLLRRAQLLVRAAAAVAAGDPERMITADEYDASQGLTAQAVAYLAAQGLLPQTSFQPMIAGQPSAEPKATTNQPHCDASSSEALASGGAGGPAGTASAAACASSVESSGSSVSSVISAARMLSPLQQEAIEAIVAEGASGRSDGAGSVKPGVPPVGGPGRSSAGAAATAAAVRSPASKVSSAAAAAQGKPAAASKVVQAPRGSMHWLPPHSLVAGRFAPAAGLVEPSASRKAALSTRSRPGSHGAATASGVTGTAPSSPGASLSELAVVWVLAPGGGPLPQLAGGDAAAAVHLLSWMPSDCAAQAALASCVSDADAFVAGTGVGAGASIAPPACTGFGAGTSIAPPAGTGVGAGSSIAPPADTGVGAGASIAPPAAVGAVASVCHAKAAEARRCFVATVAHNAAEEERQWTASVHSCPTCLTPSLPGSACWRLEGCGHVFCSQCVASHVAARLAEGEVASGSPGSSGRGVSKGMSCPDCAAPLTQGDVRAALGGHSDERYARFESLLLTATLESLARAEAAAAGGPGAAAGISGVVYCPRPWCSKPAVPVPASAGAAAVARPRYVTGSSDAYTIISPLAQCPYCDFMFCTRCQRSAHPGFCTSLVHRYRGASEAERAAMRDKYGARYFEDVATLEFIAASTKPCPGCAAPILKNGGCQHITCKACRYEWCWQCGGSYELGHYTRGPCLQYDVETLKEVFGMTESEYRAMIRGVSRA